MRTFASGSAPAASRRSARAGRRSPVWLVPVLATLVVGGCARPHNPSFARAAHPSYVDRCPDGVLAIPDVTFPELSSSALISELAGRRLLPEPAPMLVVRYDREAARIGGQPAVYGGTSGPQILDPGGFRLRVQRYRAEGGRPIAGIVAALVDADGVVHDVRTPVPREFLRRDEWRRGLVSAGADVSAAARLVRDTRFYPALHSGCRVPGWTVVYLTG